MFRPCCHAQCNSLQVNTISYMIFIWCINTSGVSWLIPARNLKPSQWLMATSSPGVPPSPSGGTSLTDWEGPFLLDFSHKTNGKYYQNPWRTGRDPLHNHHPWRGGGTNSLTRLIMCPIVYKYNTYNALVPLTVPLLYKAWIVLYNHRWSVCPSIRDCDEWSLHQWQWC